VLTEEQKAKMKAGREAKKAAAKGESPAPAEKTKPETKEKDAKEIRLPVFKLNRD